MKIKALSKRSWQSYPEVDGMIEIDEVQVKEIGATLEFDDTLSQLVPLVPNAEDKAREAEQTKQKRTIELQQILAAYTEDFAQSLAGLHVADLELRKENFRQAHAELRQLAGKEARTVRGG